MRHRCSVVLWLAAVSAATAEPGLRPELFAGHPPIWTFATREIGSSPQLWSVVELPSGHLAIGTPEGLMLYDGQAWTPVPFDNQQAARSLALGRDGILYVGGVGDVATLVFDHEGPRLRSLLPELPEGERALPVVSEIAVAGERVFFRAGPRLLCRCGGALAVVGDGFLAIAAGGDELFALRREGLFRLAAGGGLEALRGMPAELGGEGLRQLAARDARRLVLGHADGRILRLVLAEDGLSVAELAPFAPGVAGRLQRLRWLAPDRLLVATYDRGAWLLDGDGEILAHATPAQGLASPLVTDGTIDARGALWLTQDGGLSRVALHHPYREWLVSGGLGGRPVALLARPDGLLVGTVQGLVRLDREGWRRIEPVAMQTLAVAEVPLPGGGTEILAANAEGIYRVAGDRAELMPPSPSGARPVSLLPSRHAPGRLFVGQTLGVALRERRGGLWQEVAALRGPKGFVRDLGELGDGSLLAIEVGNAVWRFVPDPEAEGGYRPGQRLGGEHGVADPSLAVLLLGEEEPWLSLQGVVLRHVGDGRFEPDRRWAGLIPAQHRVAELVRVEAHGWFAILDSPGRVWAVKLARDADGAFRVERELPLSDQLGLTRIFPDRHRALLWLAGDRGLHSLDLRRPPVEPKPPRVLLREVRRGDGVMLANPLARAEPDRVAAAGLWFAAMAAESVPRLPARLARLHFSYSSPGAVGSDEIAFSHRLVGAEEGWSPYSRDGSRDYNNLPAGSYRFEVRARGREGLESEPVAFAFVVAPPWFRTPWAFVLYALLAASILRLAVLLGSRAARARAARLERLVAERTAELAQANAKLERAALTDPLTGLWNRRYLVVHPLPSATGAKDGGGIAMPAGGWAVVLVDLDHFKRINDNLGHAAGDAVLIEAARRLRAALRETDWVLRWGGEEFLCLVPLDPPVSLERLARRLLEVIGAEPFAVDGRALAVTASVGLARYPLAPAGDGHADLEASIRVADEALYQAKALGRDRAGVLTWDPTAEADARGRKLRFTEVRRP